MRYYISCGYHGIIFSEPAEVKQAVSALGSLSTRALSGSIHYTALTNMVENTFTTLPADDPDIAALMACMAPKENAPSHRRVAYLATAAEWNRRMEHELDIILRDGSHFVAERRVLQSKEQVYHFADMVRRQIK